MPKKCPQGTHFMLVTCGQPTKPPHAGEKNPGTCSRTKGFCVPPVPNWSCWQHGGSYTTVPVKRHFRDCADAVTTFNNERQNDEAAADTRPYLKFAGRVSEPKLAGKQYTTTATLTWSVDPDQTIVHQLEITWDNMTAADVAAATTATDALQAHEEGHVEIAVSYVEELNGDGGDQVTASGSTPAKAAAALTAAINQHKADVKQELDRRGQDYDRQTGHGLQQSNIGGVDTVLNCPPAGQAARRARSRSR